MNATELLPGRRAKRKQEIRTRIQDAAYDLFRDQGIKETSIEQICTAADVARRTFYSYYPDKQTLLRALSHSRVLNTAGDIIEGIIDKHPSTIARVSAVFHYILGNVIQYTEIDRRLILVGPAEDSANNHLSNISNKLQGQFRGILQAGIDNGDISSRFCPDILSEILMGTFNTLVLQWARDPDFPLAKKLEEALEVFSYLLEG